jgi:hypothetical protein
MLVCSEFAQRHTAAAFRTGFDTIPCVVETLLSGQARWTVGRASLFAYVDPLL